MKLTYLTVITLLFENMQALRNNNEENTIVLHLSVHFKVPKKTQKKTLTICRRKQLTQTRGKPLTSCCRKQVKQKLKAFSDKISCLWEDKYIFERVMYYIISFVQENNVKKRKAKEGGGGLFAEENTVMQSGMLHHFTSKYLNRIY